MAGRLSPALQPRNAAQPDQQAGSLSGARWKSLSGYPVPPNLPIRGRIAGESASLRQGPRSVGKVSQIIRLLRTLQKTLHKSNVEGQEKVRSCVELLVMWAVKTPTRF